MRPMYKIRTQAQVKTVFLQNEPTYKHFYYSHTKIDWNLPEKVAEAPSIDSFKERLS